MGFGDDLDRDQRKTLNLEGLGLRVVHMRVGVMSSLLAASREATFAAR